MDRKAKSGAVTPAAAAVPAGPEICPECFSDLVQPVSAHACGGGGVLLTLRCPECERVRTGEFSWDAARGLGRAFATGRSLLRAAHSELAKENFLDELDCFVLALAADLIGPDDFRPYRFAA